MVECACDTNLDTNPGEYLRTVANSPTTQILIIPDAANSSEHWRMAYYHTSKPVIQV
jgi:hypothetical protein